MNELKTVSGPQLKLLKKLEQKKYRESTGTFIVEGEHLVVEALSSGWEIKYLLVRKDAAEKKRFDDLISDAGRRSIKCFAAGAREFEKVADTVSSQGILALVRMPPDERSVRWSDFPDRVVAVGLNAITDPGNLGTIIRTCAWFGVDRLIVDRGCVDPYNPKVVRASMGSIFQIRCVIDADLPRIVGGAREEGIKVYSTALHDGTPPGSSDLPPRVLLLMGNESRGIDGGLLSISDGALTIPRLGKGESLNVAVACGIILHSIMRNRRY